MELISVIFSAGPHGASTESRVAYHRSSNPMVPCRSDVKYTVNSSFERTAYMSLESVFNDATGTGVDQSPNVSALRGEVPGAAVYEASRHSSIKDRLMVPPPVCSARSFVPFVLWVLRAGNRAKPTYTRRRL